MIRAVVLYDEAPDPQRYAEHVALCGNIPGATFRHGRVFGSPMGEPKHRYFAEFEWPDMESFDAGVRSDEFMASGKDAMAMGVPFSVEFVELG
jgi:hypothetical protein